MIDSKALNRPFNPLWRMNTNSTELLVIVLHLWDRGSRDVEERCMYVFGVEIKRLSVAWNRITALEVGTFEQICFGYT